MDWSFENGWLIITFILSVFASLVGIPLTILKIIDIVRKWRNEKNAKESEEISISFINLNGRVGQTVITKTHTQIKHIDIQLGIDVKNKGGFDTSVNIIGAEFKVKADDNNEYFATTRSRINTDLDLSKNPLLIDNIKARGKQNTHITFRLTDLEYDFTEAWVKFNYTFLDSEDNTKFGESDWMDVYLRFKS